MFRSLLADLVQYVRYTLSLRRPCTNHHLDDRCDPPFCLNCGQTR